MVSRWRTRNKAPRVERIVFQGQNAWRKHQVPLTGTWRLTTLDFAASRLGIPLARAVPQPGGAITLALERSRIAQLHAAGIRVPEILDITERAHVLSDVGQPLNQLLKRSPAALELAEQALCAIEQVHAAGNYLSQAFARNICVSPSGIAFIDFEDDPLQVFSLQDAQARDLLLAITSMSGYFENDMQRFCALCRNYLYRYPDPVTRSLEQSIRALGQFERLFRIFHRVREIRRLNLVARYLLPTG